MINKPQNIIQDISDELIMNDSVEILKKYMIYHKNSLENLENLRKISGNIASEMKKGLNESSSASDYFKSLLTADPGKMSENFKKIIEKIPILRNYLPECSIQEIMSNKILIIEITNRNVAQFLDKIENEIENLKNDTAGLNEKHNISQDNKTIEIISGIIEINNVFLEIFLNLQTDMTILYEAGCEVLDDLRLNLSSLETVPNAADLSCKIQESKEFLKNSVDKIAAIASGASLFLEKSVNQASTEMKFYKNEHLFE